MLIRYPLAALVAHSFGFHFNLLLVLSGLGVCVWTTELIEGAITRRDKSLTVHLALFDDKRAVGPLLDALAYDGAATVNAASVALIRLLPQLHASDRRLLTTEQYSVLNSLIANRFHTSAILRLGPHLDKFLGAPYLQASARSQLILVALQALSQI